MANPILKEAITPNGEQLDNIFNGSFLDKLRRHNL